MANSDLKFRIATPDDAARIQALVEAAFRAEDSRPDWTADMKLGSSFRIGVETILSQITKPDGAILMAIDGEGEGKGDDALVASVEVSRRDDLARVSMLAVDLRRQRGGLGRQVLAHAEDYCRRAWGVHRIGLNALSTREQLISWYMRRGYQKTGETSPFPKERLGELELSEDLHFIELEKDLDAA